MTSDQISFAKSDKIATVTFSRPEARNALTIEMLDRLQHLIDVVEIDDDVSVLLIHGEGPNFCSGLDLAEFPPATAPHDVRLHIRGGSLHFHAMIRSLIRLPKPVVIAAHGTNAGGGLGLMGAGDFLLVAEGTKGLPAWLAIGLPPDAGASYVLPRTVGLRRAMEWVMTNKAATADEMVDWGFANAVVPQGELIDEAVRLAISIARFPLPMLGAAKQLLHRGSFSPIDGQVEDERDAILRGAGSAFFLDALAQFAAKTERPALRGNE